MNRVKGPSLGWLVLSAWVLSMAYWLGHPPRAITQELLALVLREESSGKALWCVPVRPQEEFVLEFLHSYDRFPVREHYTILGPGRIRFSRLLTRSMLNGQGFVAAGAHTRPDGWLETDGEQAARASIEFIMGIRQHADHRILLGGREHHLSEFIQPGTFVLLETQTGDCTGLGGERQGKY